MYLQSTYKKIHFLHFSNLILFDCTTFFLIQIFTTVRFRFVTYILISKRGRYNLLNSDWELFTKLGMASAVIFSSFMNKYWKFAFSFPQKKIEYLYFEEFFYWHIWIRIFNDGIIKISTYRVSILKINIFCLYIHTSYYKFSHYFLLFYLIEKKN